MDLRIREDDKRRNDSGVVQKRKELLAEPSLDLLLLVTLIKNLRF